MKKLKIRIFYVFLVIFMISFPITSFAHSGRTDSSGGHHDYKNKSGLGSYHYHHGLGPHLHPGGVCPYGGSSTNKSSAKSYTSPSISITNYPDTLNVGDSAGFEYSVSNATSSNSSVTSSDTSVIKIGTNNTLKAVGAGTAQITIEASGVKRTFTVKVVAVPVEEVIISNATDKIQLGDDYKFEAIILPENSTNKNITWLSDNTDVLEINESGNIETKSSGIATITALADNHIENKITIEIFEVIPDSIECDDSINLAVGEKESYKIDILPSNANNKEFKVTCDDENVLKYSEFSIQAVSEGKTTLHIKTWNGVVKDIPVTVNIIPVESVNIIDSTKYFMSNIIDKNNDIILETEIIPSNATYQNIEWKSSDNSIVMIDDNNLKIVGTGKVTLTCYAHENVANSITLYIIDKTLIGLNIFIISTVIIILLIIIHKLLLKKKTITNSKNYNIINSKSDAKENDSELESQKESKLLPQSDSKELQEKKDTILNVRKDFLNIKKLVISKANAGHYNIKDDKKCISINYECLFLLDCIAKKDPKNFSDNILNDDKEVYYVENIEKYNLYLYVIKKCASIDGLMIHPLFVIIDESNKKVSRIDLPYISDCENTTQKIKVYLRCTIKY